MKDIIKKKGGKNIYTKLASTQTQCPFKYKNEWKIFQKEFV